MSTHQGRTRERLPRYHALFAGSLCLLVAALAAACSHAASSSGADACTALDACCASLASPAGSACTQQVGAARAESDSQGACGTLLDGYRSGGLCAGTGSSSSSGASSSDGSVSGDGRANGDGGPGGGEPSVCARYVDCVAADTPADLPATIQAYGPSGTCWSSTGDVASACVTACTTGVADLHRADPASCPLCASNADCAGNAAGNACNVSAGTCVACAADSDCSGSPGGPACDTGTSTCVACTSDAQCTSSTKPHCDASAHACAGCVANDQCASKVCNGGSCCTPAACNKTLYQCGLVPDGCGHEVTCGACALGTCSENKCTTIGVQCTPGTAGQCVPGEACLADDWHQDYRCSPTGAKGATCSTYPDPNCGGGQASDNTPVDTFTCVNDVCAQNCLVQADCPTGTCTPWSPSPGNPQPITPALPGQCL